MKRVMFFFIFIAPVLFCNLVAGENDQFTIRGKVVDSKSKSTLPGVIIRVMNTLKGTLSDDNGNFQINLPKGKYELQFSIVGYNTDIKRIDLNQNENMIIELKESFVQLSEVLVVAEDPGVGIIRRAIANKRRWMERLQSYKFTAYSKQIINKEDSIASIAESYSNGYWRKNDGYRERIYQKRQTENIPLSQNFAMVGGIVNFNEDVIQIAGYKFTGPTSPDALDDYYFKLIKTYESKGFNIYEIEMKPASKFKPLFEGIICISDSIYSITKVEVKPNDVFKIPFVKNFALNLSQRFSVYDTSYWMPADIAINAKFEIGIPVLQMPAFGFKQRSILYDFEINKPVPDTIFTGKKIVSDSLKTDSLYWEKNRVLPLTNLEEKMYKTLDSTQTLDKQFRPTGALMMFEKSSGSNFFAPLEYVDFRFNRVEGYYLGGQFDTKIYKNLSGAVTAGYGFSDKKSKYTLMLENKFPRLNNSSLSAVYYYMIADRPGMDFYSASAITIAAILTKADYGDYYSAKGFNIKYSIYPFKNIRATVKYTNEDQKSLVTKAGHGMISSKKFRENLPIFDGSMRNLKFDLDFFDLFKLSDESFIQVNIGEKKPAAAFSLETSGNALGSSYDYSKYNFMVSADYPTFLRSLFLKPYISFEARGGFSPGKLPPQRLFYLESVYDGFAPFGTFRSMGMKDYDGDSYLEFHVEHNFRTLPFRMINFSWIEEQGIELILFTSLGKTWLSEDSKKYLNSTAYKATDGWYSEMGFGLSKILLFFRTDFTWRLTHRKENNFFFSFRVANIL